MAVVTAEPRMVMHWQGETIVSLSRECWIFRSSGALPFWTSLAMVWRDFWLWLLEEPVAQPRTGC